MRSGITAALLGIALAPAGATSGGPPPGQVRPVVCVVPFRNLSGDATAVATLRGIVGEVLEQRGFRIGDDGEIADLLRRRRMRSRDAPSSAELAELAAACRAQLVLVGRIEAWRVDRGPRVGLAARLVDPESGRILWAGAASVHAMEAPGLLARGRPESPEQAAARAVRELLTTLTWSRGPAGRGQPATKPRKYSRALLAEAPVAFRAPHLDPRARLRIAILPLTNLTDDVSAATVVGTRMLAALQGRRELSLVDPGELRRALIDGNIRPLDGVGPPQLESLRDALGIDALLDGTLLRFDPGGADAPRIDLFVRLRDARTGAVLWSATTSRDGDETRTLFDAGRIRDPDRLAEAVVADLLSTWFR